MNEFKYNRLLYLFDVIITGIVAIGAFIASLVYFHSNLSLLLLIGIVCIYTIWNSFVSKVHPEKIVIKENEIVFETFNSKDRYYIDGTDRFQLREFPSSGKLYLRIGNEQLQKGRYWINTKNYNNGKELFQLFRDLDYKINPDSLKSKARRVNTEYLQKIEEK
jgi:hypothetical protein